MISVVIPTLNAAANLPATLSALVPAAVSNLVREVVIVDGGSSDETLDIAEDAGARLVEAGARPLAAGCEAAKGPWLLLLRAGARLGGEWEAAARDHIEHHDREAGYFRFALDDHRTAARLREAAEGLRVAAFGLPREGQGLLLSKRLFEAIGGVPDGAGSEQTALAGRLRGRLRPLSARAFAPNLLARGV